MKYSLSFLIFFCFWGHVNAQKLLPLQGIFHSRSELFISLGLEPELTTSIGYRYMPGNAAKDFSVGGRLKFAPLILDQAAYKMSLFAARSITFDKQTKVWLQPEIYLAHLTDRAAGMSTLGFELTAMPYWYGKRWSKGVEITWQQAALTYIRHSAFTRGAFEDRYPSSEETGPVNGWYASTVSRLRVGFTAAKEIGPHLGMQFTAGTQVIRQKQKIILGFSHAQIPVYLEGGVRYLWP